ncbi:MAG TPA: hypothetical protein VGA77_11720 [Propylenella sp.]
MRLAPRIALFGALALAPAAAFAQWPWPFPQPSLQQAEAEMIALQSGITNIEDVDATIDGDWFIEGTDPVGNHLELVIDGSTGAIERAEMHAD